MEHMMGTMMSGQSQAAMRDDYSNAKIQTKRKTKMSMKQRIRNWLKDDDSEKEEWALPMNKTISAGPPDQLNMDGLNITIHNANGGYVAQFRRYDTKTDRNSAQLYLITSDQKFEEALAHCIAMECLSR
jgi:hypothetical protein